MRFTSQDKVEEVITALEKGDVIVYPTETSYGVGCDATNLAAVERIFKIKHRPKGKGFVILLPDIESAGQFVNMSEKALELANEHWPGGLNIVAPVLKDSPISVDCSSSGLQAVRVSSHPFASELVRTFGKPIVSTSANISGDEPLYTLDGIEDVFETDKPDILVDAGELPVRPTSTVVKIEGDNVEVLREGELKL